jgi:nucleoside phosphorylase
MTWLDPNLYTVAFFASLEVEVRAALLMLDRRHHGRFPIYRANHSVVAGEMCGHNVIIMTLLCNEKYDPEPMATVASQVKVLFPNLRFGLLVGVAAGLPSPSRDIRLGDVLVCHPTDEGAELIAYDSGKEAGGDGFQRLGQYLRSGPMSAEIKPVISAIDRIKLEAPNDTAAFLPYYESIDFDLEEWRGSGTFLDPGQDKDLLYETETNGIEYMVVRQARPDTERVRVWYGPLGSGEELLNAGSKRNELRDKYGVIGLNMRAGGVLMRSIPVVIIRGVCGYGDEHKYPEWQLYAAAMAAAYAKAVLSETLPK